MEPSLVPVNSSSCACEDVLNELSGIAGMVNHRMSMSNLHERIDIFFYIDSSIRARDLCSKIRQSPGGEHLNALKDLYEQVTARWKKDHENLSLKPRIVL